MTSLFPLVVPALLAVACGSGDGGESPEGGHPSGCPDLAGDFVVGSSCTSTGSGHGSASSGTFAATMTQNGCEISLIQKDDKTPTEWVSKGTIDETGKLTLTGDFGFTVLTECLVQVANDGWTGTCASADGTETCELEAQRYP